MSLEKQGRQGKRFSENRRYRRRFHREAAETADEEIKSFEIGLPAQEFFLPDDTEGDLIFRAPKRQSTKVRPPREKRARARDIRERMSNQISRYIEIEQDGALTPQWKRFGRKHREQIWSRQRAIRVQVS